MAKYKATQSKQQKSFIMLLLLVAALVIAVVAVVKGNEFRNSSAANPLAIQPCSGSWNTADCFVVGNPKTYPVRFAYLIDCYDTNYCEDKTAIVTLLPGKTIVLGQPNTCSKWQLDIAWTNPDTANATGSWEWGAIVEKSTTAVCTCNNTELKIQPVLNLP